MNKIDKHWKGQHTQDCNVYSLAYLGMVCRYTGKGNFMQSDYLRRLFSPKGKGEE